MKPFAPATDHKIWSGRRDLNSRHPGPKPGALPDYATPRKDDTLLGTDDVVKSWGGKADELKDFLLFLVVSCVFLI